MGENINGNYPIEYNSDDLQNVKIANTQNDAENFCKQVSIFEKTVEQKIQDAIEDFVLTEEENNDLAALSESNFNLWLKLRTFIIDNESKLKGKIRNAYSSAEKIISRIKQKLDNVKNDLMNKKIENLKQGLTWGSSTRQQSLRDTYNRVIQYEINRNNWFALSSDGMGAINDFIVHYQDELWDKQKSDLRILERYANEQNAKQQSENLSKIQAPMPSQAAAEACQRPRW